MRQPALVNPEGAVKARKRVPAAGICRRHRKTRKPADHSLPIMRTGMVNGL
jgi:hypothetical protein